MAAFYAFATVIYFGVAFITAVTSNAQSYRDYGIAILWPLFFLKEIVKALKAGFGALAKWD